MDEKEQDIKTDDVISEESTLDLGAIRKSRGLTLKDVASSTRVSLQNLKAIEEQTFELLPEPIYARAFIDTYAKALNVDGKKILSLYDKYLKSLQPDKDRHEVLKKLAAKKRHLKVWIWVIIVSGVLALAGSFFLYQCGANGRQAAEGLSPSGKTEPAGELQNAPEEMKGDVAIKGEAEPSDAGSAPPAGLPVVDSTQKTEQATKEGTPPPIEAEKPAAGGEQPAIVGEQPKEAPRPDTIVPAAKKPYTLVIEASELTWIQIEKDGGAPFEVMLWPGEKTTERASKSFDLLIGNAGGVDIRFQGKSLGPLGERGEVIRVTLPADR